MRRVLSEMLDGFIHLVGQIQAGGLAGQYAPSGLRETDEQQAEPERQDNLGYPERDRQVFGLDADHEQQVDVGVSAVEQQRRVEHAQGDGNQGDDLGDPGRQVFDHQVDADMGTDSHAVGHADQHQPGKQEYGQFQRPDETCVEHVTQDDLRERHQGHGRQQQRDQPLFQTVDDPAHHCFSSGCG